MFSFSVRKWRRRARLTAYDLWTPIRWEFHIRRWCVVPSWTTPHRERMLADDDIAGANRILLQQVSRRARKDFRRASRWAREVQSTPAFKAAAEHAEITLTKYLAARKHADPRVREAWAPLKSLGFPETRALTSFLPNPLARPGRPKGTGYADLDEPIVEALRARVRDGEPMASAARELAKGAAGGGTIESKAARLQTRAREREKRQ